MSNERYDLKELKEAANKACEAAYRAPMIESVNWDDLCCISAKKSIDDEGNIEYQVLISEAAPTAYKLQLFVAESLMTAGFPDVEVVTEW